MTNAPTITQDPRKRPHSVSTEQADDILRSMRRQGDKALDLTRALSQAMPMLPRRQDR